jgi:TonB family protein
MLALAILCVTGLAGAARAADDHWAVEDEGYNLPPRDEIAGDAEKLKIYEARIKWQANVLKRLKANTVQPSTCDTADPCGGGDIIMSFAVDPEGRIFDQQLVRSSHSPARDTAALATLNRVNPLPAPPLFEDEDSAVLEVQVQRVKKPDGPALLPEHSNVNPSLLRPQRW